jgi:integrase
MANRVYLTDRFLKAIKPAPAGKRPIIYDTGGPPGAGVRLSDRTTAAKVPYVLVARLPGGSGNPTPYPVGHWPVKGLADLRELTRQAKRDIEQGIHPKARAERQRQEAARARATTFGAVFERFCDEKLTTIKSGRAVKRAVTRRVLDLWRDRPIQEVASVDIRPIVALIARKERGAAIKVHAYLRQFFNWAKDQELIDANPVDRVQLEAKPGKRDRWFDDREIEAFWQATEAIKARHPRYALAFRALLLTGQRRDEIGSMTWAEIDRDRAVWSLAGERTKARRAHAVMLSPSILAILDECAQTRLGDHVFATGRRKSDGATTGLSGWTKAKSALDKAMVERYAAILTARADAPAPLRPWRTHDLRHTVAIWLPRLGVDRTTQKKVLNHADGAVKATYDHYDRDAEKKLAMGKWAAKIEAIVNRPDGENVVQLAEAAAARS